MSENATPGKGALLERGDQLTATNFLEIGEVGDIEGPSYSRDSIKTSDQRTLKDNGGYHVFIPGIVDAGEVTLPIFLRHGLATHRGLLEDVHGPNRYWRIRIPEDPEAFCTFVGHVTGLSPAYPKEEAVTADITLKVSGKPVWS